MKKLLLLLLIVPLFIACKKEDEAEPLSQFHFINFVDESGANVFESGKIDTLNFLMHHEVPWKALMKEKHHRITSSVQMHEGVATQVSESNPFLLFEDFQGTRERTYIINGHMKYFLFSPLEEGFFQNGEKLSSVTETIQEWKIYVHHVVIQD